MSAPAGPPGAAETQAGPAAGGQAGDEHYLKRELDARMRTDGSLFEFLQAGSLDGIWFWDLEHPEHEWISPRLWEVLGYAPESKRHLAAEWQELIHPDDLRVAIANFEAHCADPAHPYDQCVRYRHRDGSTVWVRCRGIAIRDAAGKPIRLLGAHTDITALKRAEHALARWAHVVEQAGWGVAIASPDAATLEDVNPELARMHGRAPAELAGARFLDLVAPEARARAAAELELACARGRHSYRSRHARADGDAFPALVSVTTIEEAGAVTGRAIQVVDLTEREQREHELRAASLSRDVLDRLLEGCQVIGFDRRYLYVNDLLAQQIGRPKEALLGRTMSECYPGIEQTEMFRRLERSMLDRRHDQMENEFVFPDGRRVLFQLSFVPVPQGVCVLSLDITERRHRLAAIVQDSHDAIIGCTLDGTVTSWNKSAERIFGYTAAEIVGRGIAALYAPGLEGEQARLAARVRAGERIEPFEGVRLRKDGSPIDVWVTLSPVRDPDDRIIGISDIVRDVTEQKRAQLALVRAKERAEAVSRELESFSYSVAHDLRAPLRSIDGFSRALLEDCGDQLDETGHKYLRFVRESAQRMAQLIDDVLALSRVTQRELQRRPVDLSALARETLGRLGAAEPARRVEAVVQDGLVAWGDARLLGIALDNLLGNAWKFTARRPVARIEVGAVAQGGGRAYFVRDDGAGFDAANAPELFGVFQRFHAATEFEGTGVGLATVQRIVHRHGGRVWAESRPGEGATLYFTLGAPERDEGDEGDEGAGDAGAGDAGAAPGGGGAR